MPHAADTHRTVLAAANAVARAATPKRKLAVRDEFGPHRGRPFTLTAAAPARRGLAGAARRARPFPLRAAARARRGLGAAALGRRVSRRSATAYEVAC